MVATIEQETVDETESSPARDGTLRRVVWFGAVIVVLLLVRTFVGEPARVRSDSMSPSLPDGAVVVIDKVSLLVRDPRSGEIVVAADPRNGDSIIKRVVAVGGDSVGIENGVLVVNGVTIIEPYVDNHNMDGFYFGPEVVPAGHVFVLGDNRGDSEDSRLFGPIPFDDVEGRVLSVLWPRG